MSHLSVLGIVKASKLLPYGRKSVSGAKSCIARYWHSHGGKRYHWKSCTIRNRLLPGNTMLPNFLSISTLIYAAKPTLPAISFQSQVHQSLADRNSSKSSG